MKYEIDFLGINQKSQDADAISFRYYDDILHRFVVVVYDGGLKTYGAILLLVSDKSEFGVDNNRQEWNG